MTGEVVEERQMEKWGTDDPSVLHFKRGRGLEVKRALSVSPFEGGREMGVVGRRRAPSILCFKRGREMGVVGRKRAPSVSCFK